MKIDERFHNLLKQHNLNKCQCGKEIDRGDVAWNCGSPDENGSPFSVLEIICQACDNEIFHTYSWDNEVANFEDFVVELEKVFEEGKD